MQRPYGLTSGTRLIMRLGEILISISYAGGRGRMQFYINCLFDTFECIQSVEFVEFQSQKKLIEHFHTLIKLSGDSFNCML